MGEGYKIGPWHPPKRENFINILTISHDRYPHSHSFHFHIQTRCNSQPSPSSSPSPPSSGTPVISYQPCSSLSSSSSSWLTAAAIPPSPTIALPNILDTIERRINGLAAANLPATCAPKTIQTVVTKTITTVTTVPHSCYTYTTTTGTPGTTRCLCSPATHLHLPSPELTDDSHSKLPPFQPTHLRSNSRLHHSDDGDGAMSCIDGSLLSLHQHGHGPESVSDLSEGVCYLYRV
jgi:hypothetical protein